ncbi:hypothetical protein midi_01167 [Candidatus Midichloria mitochondrii IricVA]|uniref:Uncharacterized protein n=1 Tax=Midichloria mitochondrii (strain IricVA) TaxID=696127 RepID=F7XU84_MIDMI|nr:hypothetical protein midi_01167 [Candidatus Midichloria mitochondrii IricVA]
MRVKVCLSFEKPSIRVPEQACLYIREIEVPVLSVIRC